PMVCVMAAEVLPVKLALPPKTTLMEWLPTDRAGVVNVAVPLVSVVVLSVLLPSRKVTLPVGVPPAEATVAVKVTGWPNTAVVRAEEVTVVVVGAGLTVCVRANDVAALKLVSPA